MNVRGTRAWIRGGRPGSPPGDAAHGGFVAGLEALAFGVLVFVVGPLLLLNAWAVVDAAFVAGAAAREAVRAVVEARPPDADGAPPLDAIARSAARRTVEAHGYEATSLHLAVRSPGGALTAQRCAVVRIEATIEVRGVVLPGVDAVFPSRVTAGYEEVVDPLRSGLAARPGLDRVPEEGNPCGF